MTVLIKEDVGSATHWHEEIENGVFPVPLELVNRTYRGVPLSDLSQLWPEDALRREVKRIAEFWLRTRSARDWDLDTAMGDIRLWGPYLHRDWDGAARASQMRAVGWSEAQILDSGLVDMILQARFRYPHVKEIEA